MYVSETARDVPFTKGRIVPYGGISLEPAATVLNYGQGLFEGMKVLRQANGNAVLFRPLQNAARVRDGCERLCLPSVSDEVFLDAVRQTAIANGKFIPPHGQGALYLRPIVFGSGPALGVAPSPWYHMIVYACPVGAYFKQGAAGVDLEVCLTYHRAAPKGVGCVKSISNYAPAFRAQLAAKKKGYADALFLDTHDRNVEEAGAANFFVVGRDGVVRTPALGSILPGVTRDSVLKLAKKLGLKTEEKTLSIDEVMEGKEAWCTGTAAVITPVASITHGTKKTTFDKNSPVAKAIYEEFSSILNGTKQDTFGWLDNPWEHVKQ